MNEENKVYASFDSDVNFDSFVKKLADEGKYILQGYKNAVCFFNNRPVYVFAQGNHSIYCHVVSGAALKIADDLSHKFEKWNESNYEDYHNITPYIWECRVLDTDLILIDVKLELENTHYALFDDKDTVFEGVVESVADGDLVVSGERAMCFIDDNPVYIWVKSGDDKCYVKCDPEYLQSILELIRKRQEYFNQEAWKDRKNNAPNIWECDKIKDDTLRIRAKVYLNNFK